MTFRVAPVGHAAALYAVQHWHYSGTLPVPPQIFLGVWEDDTYIGAMVFSRGNAPTAGKRWSLSQEEMAELTRVALSTHHVAVSQVVAIGLRWLKEHNPRLRLVVSFADPDAGHHGGIYQAGNWFYLGQSSPTKLYRDKSGRMWHSRQVSTTTGWKTQFGQARRAVKGSDCTVVLMPGKHRYLMPLDKAMRRQVAKFAQPYPPPCDRSVEGDAPGFHLGDAGSTPADRSIPPAADHLTEVSHG